MPELSKKRYLFLVEREKNLKQKGERLSSSDSRELHDYKCFSDRQLTYNHRFEYLSLFENYLTGQIGLEHFYAEFTALFGDLNFTSRRDEDQLSNLTLQFEIASNITQFQQLIYEIWEHYECVYVEKLDKAMYDSNYQPNFESTINLIHTKYQEIKKCFE